VHNGFDGPNSSNGIDGSNGFDGSNGSPRFRSQVVKLLGGEHLDSASKAKMCLKASPLGSSRASWRNIMM
jgi:hypothetical protein